MKKWEAESHFWKFSKVPKYPLAMTSSRTLSTSIHDLCNVSDRTGNKARDKSYNPTAFCKVVHNHTGFTKTLGEIRANMETDDHTIYQKPNLCSTLLLIDNTWFAETTYTKYAPYFSLKHNPHSWFMKLQVKVFVPQLKQCHA